MDNKYQMSAIGDLLIGITVSNLAINVIPLPAPIFLFIYKRLILKYYIKYKREKAEKIKKKHLLEKLRNRT